MSISQTYEQSLKNCQQAHKNAKAVIPYKSNFSIGGSIPNDRTAEGYLRAYGEIGWLHAVMFRIALGCSEVKWTLSDVTNRDKPKQIYEHPILSLLHLVNPLQTSNEFIALDTLYQELVGESFWALNFNRLGEPAEIVLPYPHKMSVVPAREFPFVKGYVYGVGNEAVPFDVNEIIHFKYPNPLNQYRGMGQAQAIGVELDSEQYSSQWIRQFFYNSARPDGVIQFDYNLSDEQFEKLKKQWSEKYKGVSKAHQVALLEGGGKYLQIQNSVKDMDFPNLKLKNRDSILGVVGMPLSVMGISENVNKANAEAGDYTFARWIVKPRLDWKVAKLQEQLIPKFRNSQNLQLGFEEVVPETIEQKMLLAESGIRAGYLTINEARKLRGLDPLPNGDVLLVPLNLIPTPVSGKFSIPAPAPVSAPEEEVTEEPNPKGKGGEGSGNFDHEGRPGEVGGSGEGGGGDKPSGDKPSGGDGGGGSGSGGGKHQATHNSLAEKQKKTGKEQLAVVDKDGKVVMELTGVSGTQVDFKPGQLDKISKIPGATMIHTHPDDHSFSMSDMGVGISKGIVNQEVVTPDHVFKFSTGKKYTPQDANKFAGDYEKSTASLSRKYAPKIKNGTMSLKQANVLASHEAAATISEKWGFKYSREKR